MVDKPEQPNKGASPAPDAESVIVFDETTFENDLADLEMDTVPLSAQSDLENRIFDRASKDKPTSKSDIIAVATLNDWRLQKLSAALQGIRGYAVPYFKSLTDLTYMTFILSPEKELISVKAANFWDKHCATVLNDKKRRALINKDSGYKASFNAMRKHWRALTKTAGEFGSSFQSKAKNNKMITQRVDPLLGVEQLGYGFNTSVVDQYAAEWNDRTSAERAYVGGDVTAEDKQHIATVLFAIKAKAEKRGSLEKKNAVFFHLLRHSTKVSRLIGRQFVAVFNEGIKQKIIMGVDPLKQLGA